jgi:hypothetical protein
VTDIDNWLIRYGESHETLRNPFVYWAAVPMLVVGLTGLLWALPVPGEFMQISLLLNWGSAFLMVTAIYYFIISLALAIGLLPFLLGLASIQLWLANSGYPPIAISTGLIVAGVVGIALGRGGQPRAILQDLQMVMIGPAWLLSVIYKRFRIPV